MKFLEYQVKERFRAAGVPVPDGRLARSPDEAALAAGALGPIAVKAQVPVGGRGKAGGIKLAKTAADAKRVAGEILGMTIKGYTVKEVLCETAQEITRELYLGLTLDRLITGKDPDPDRSWAVVEQQQKVDSAKEVPTPEERSYAEWFAWAKRGGAPASACHAAAQGAFQALSAGKDVATAVQWATAAMTRPPVPVSAGDAARWRREGRGRSWSVQLPRRMRR